MEGVIVCASAPYLWSTGVSDPTMPGYTEANGSRLYFHMFTTLEKFFSFQRLNQNRINSNLRLLVRMNHGTLVGLNVEDI
jgi:hypothetical protein